jgi:multidrug transporter EmrE-like cation transporter
MLYKVLLFVGVGLNVLAQFSLKWGMKQVGLVEMNQGIINKLKLMLTNVYFWGGIIIYGISFLIYSIVLSKIELSRASPVSSVFAIILVVLISVVFLRESVSIIKVAGVLCCMLGIFLIFK